MEVYISNGAWLITLNIRYLDVNQIVKPRPTTSITWGTCSSKTIIILLGGAIHQIPVVGQTTLSNTLAGSNLSVISFLCCSTNTYIVLFRVLNWNITYTKKRELHTKGTESSAETTIDDIQIATTADVPYTRAEYDLSESNCIRKVFRITHNR